MRIAFITNNYTPYTAGVVSSINASCKALQQQGHEVIIITLDFLGAAHHDPAHVVRLPSCYKGKYKQNYLALPIRAYAHMRAAIERFAPDVIHSHHPFILGITALRVARDLHIPIIFTFHTLYESYVHYVPLPASLCKLFVRTRMRAYGNAVDALIAPSNPIVSYIQQYDIQKPITVIPSGLQTIFVHPTCPVKASCQRGVVQLLLVSRFTHEKNIPFILRALALVQQRKPGLFHATFAGYGYAFDEIQAYANTLKLPSESIIFKRNPSQSEIAVFYTQADIFLFASTTETQGLVLVEAMAAGALVISIDGPAQSTLIDNGHNGFLVADEEEMSARICTMIEQPEIRLHLQHNAWETAHRYTAPEVTRNLVNLYKATIKSR